VAGLAGLVMGAGMSRQGPWESMPMGSIDPVRSVAEVFELLVASVGVVVLFCHSP